MNPCMPHTIVRPRRRSPVRVPRRAHLVRPMLFALAGALAGCAARGAPEEPPPQPVVQAYEQEAIRSATPDRPLQVVFDWSIKEPDARFSGRGVTRFEPPLRARLDLFGPRGEGVLSAALIDLDLRVPNGTGDVHLPPPALLWSALGVFRPPEGATLAETEKKADDLRLVYRKGADRWTFNFSKGLLRSAEWTGEAEGRRTVELSDADPHGIPREAVYRDWPAFRELKLTLSEVHEVDAFPPDTWHIGSR